MTTIFALAGHKITSARINLPAWGRPFADVSIDGEVSLSGQVDLVVADLALKGFVLSGGPATGRSHFRLVGGKGGWGKTLARKSYANDAGVKLSTILGDAANEAGETLDASSFDPSKRVGPAFVRPEAPACRVLEQLAPSAWYVGADGVTRLGRRPSSTLPTHVTRTTPVDRARGEVTLASEAIAAIVPGVVVDGLEAVDVVHEISAKNGLRSTIYGRIGGLTSRRLEAFRKIFDQLDPRRKFRSTWEYRVVTLEGNRVNLQPVLVSTGMPDLQRVPIRPGLAGGKSDLTLGSRVLVGFVNEDPARPFVAGFEDPDAEGFLPVSTTINAQTAVRLGAGLLPAARQNDLAAGIWPIVTTQTKVLT